MNSSESTLGTCPLCDVSIPSERMLIRYVRDGNSTMFVTCPVCDEVVRPH